jgi:hypothetical protein
MTVARLQSGENPVVTRPARVSSFGGVFFPLFIVATENGLARGFSVAIVNFMEKTRERGRPPKPPEDRKTAELRIRLTPEQRATLDAAADVDTSTWARDVLLRAAKRRSRD